MNLMSRLMQRHTNNSNFSRVSVCTAGICGLSLRRYRRDLPRGVSHAKASTRSDIIYESFFSWTLRVCKLTTPLVGTYVHASDWSAQSALVMGQSKHLAGYSYISKKGEVSDVKPILSYR